MKTKMRKIGLPIVVALVAIAGAFASNLSRQKKDFLEDRIGFIRVGEICVSTSIICSTISNPQFCSDGTNTLFDWNGTSCPIVLFRKID